MFPPEFVKSAIAELGGNEARQLLEALDSEPVVSVRYNPCKISEFPFLEPIPWSRYGFYLTQRPIFTLDPMWHAGAYYVQEPSSQFTEYIYREAVGTATPSVYDCHHSFPKEGNFPTLKLLDLCAAPGGKTTLYSSLVGPNGLVVANEPVKNRASVLVDNVKRWGLGNVAVTCNEPNDYAVYKHFFDVVAIDAPCSGEGMFRKDPNARAEWSPQGVEMCAARQRKIITDVWDALRPGGILIYSTCTFNRRENEDNVRWLAENFDVEPLSIDVPKEWNINGNYEIRNTKHELATQNTFRFFPHKARGEGFFACVLRKAEGKLRREVPRAKKQPLAEIGKAEAGALAGWLQDSENFRFARAGDNCYAIYRPQYEAVAALAGGLNVIYSGVCMGQTFGGKLRPDHALALFTGLDKTKLATTELTREEALDYLRKRDFVDVSRLREGLNLLTHEGLAIGWTKRIGGRANSLLPNGFRIVNL